jgi:hypothetical protein
MLSISVWAEFPVRADRALRRHLRFQFFDLQFVLVLSELDGSDGFADLAYINASRALCLAGEACCTEPAGVGFEDFVETQLKIANDLMR